MKTRILAPYLLVPLLVLPINEEENPMMDACANLEEELTVDIPADLVPLRNIGFMEAQYSAESVATDEEDDDTVVEAYPLQIVYPPHYEPPIRRVLALYFKECVQRARELREYERVQYANTVYQRTLRLLARLYAHAKKNANSKPWEDYERSVDQKSVHD